MTCYIKLMRPHHYIKNFLIFGALVCSGQLFDLVKFKTASTGFAAFCAVSSIVYIINDIRDKEQDRLHPVKQVRPIASGRVSVRNAWMLAVFLLLLALVFNYFIYHPSSTCLLALYLVLNILYSFGLKNVPLLDVAILVSGFLIRMLYGAIITEIPISSWLYLTVITLAFYFSLGKRRNEIKSNTDRKAVTRTVLQYYSIDFLDKNMYMCLALANTFYALWCMDSGTISHYGLNLTFTVPLVLLITMKYSMDVEGRGRLSKIENTSSNMFKSGEMIIDIGQNQRFHGANMDDFDQKVGNIPHEFSEGLGADGDPVEVLLHDQVLCLLCLFYISVMFFLLYL